MKVAVPAPALTLTEAGTVRAVGRLFDRVTVAAVCVVLESVTVQVVEPDAASVVAAHCREEMLIGLLVTVMLSVRLLVPRVAVRVGV